MGEVVGFRRGPSWRERLEKAAQHERDARQAYKLALQARNELVHEAVDEGFPQTYVARALGVTRPTVTRILAEPPHRAAA